jgi:predicted DsbA family dithiol-disulfide isomerase
MESGSMFELFSDFNCPFCYALHERLHHLDVIDRCEWRGVQHAPYLPYPMKSWQGSLRTELQHEVTVVQRLAPGLPIALPRGKPNTRAAIERAIALLRSDRRRGMEFVRQVYLAFWCDGRDLSDQQVLTQLAGESAKEESSEHVRRIAQEWETAWHSTGQAGVPLIVSSEGNLLVGCVPTKDIVRFFGQNSNREPEVAG